MPRTHNPKSAVPAAAAAVRPAPEEIAAKAYDLYQQRGASDGGDVNDWLEAERQLMLERRSRLIVN
jgi:hypothetical protein